MKHILYIDESGDFGHNDKNKKQCSLIAGYYISGENISHNEWANSLKHILEDLTKNYGEINHRNKLNKDKKDEISINLIKSFKKNANNTTLKFFSITNDKPEGLDIYYDYFNMMADLIGSMLSKLLKNNYNLDVVNDIEFIFASRKDIQRSDSFDDLKTKLKEKIKSNDDNIDLCFDEMFDTLVRINESSYKQVIENEIAKLLLALGIPKEKLNIDIKVYSATIDYALLLADYTSNIIFNIHNHNVEEETKNKYSELLNLESKELHLKFGHKSSHLDNLNRNYSAMLDSYLDYKKWQTMKNEKNSHNDIIEELEKNLQIRKNSNDERYFTTAFIALLGKIEYQSNKWRNYNLIDNMYKILSELIIKLAITNKSPYNFAINTEKIAVANHSGKFDLIGTMISDNENMVGSVLNNSLFYSYLWIFYNVSAVYYNDLYDSEKAVEITKIAIDKYTKYGDIMELVATDIVKTNSYKHNKNELAKFYGTLGQSYSLDYLLYNKNEAFDEAKKCFDKAIELFENNIGSIDRQYNYLLKLAMLNNNVNDYFKYWADKENLGTITIENCEALVLQVLSKNNYDKHALLCGVLRFYENDISKKIIEILCKKKDKLIAFDKPRSYIEKLILRDWAYLLYIRNKNNKDVMPCLEKINISDKDNISIGMQMLEVSVNLVKLEIDSKKETFKKIQESLIKVVEKNDKLKNVYVEFLKKYDEVDTKEWIKKLKLKLY